MRSSHWCASLAAVGGLAGSLVMGASVSSSAVPADRDGGRPGAGTHAWPVNPAPASAGSSAQRKAVLGGSVQPRVCRGLVPAPLVPALRPYFFCGDWRLGPRWLPTQGALGHILYRYDRLGGLTAVRFLDRWWDPSADSGQGDWRYPPDDGYTHRNQTVLAAPYKLRVGQKVDRFGAEAGRFLAPVGTKYGKRSIPPSSLNTMDPRYPYDYHVYKVRKSVTVCAGKTAPGFEQPGLGVQYVTSSQFCPGIPRTTVGDLVRNGTLARVNRY
ncbi:TNT domain-containing protein [Streptomyces sp. NPDC059668]|uniref:TNT domain-containing protein n=1 Tax=Streptomyces sp. NPDC059668 TaxID=3346900 RepID=UPI0036BF0FCD